MPSVFLQGHDGDSLEAAVAMLLCLDDTSVARRKAGRGDKGIDVFVPLPDGRMDVYQVKRHTTELTANQWSKIRHSLETLTLAHSAGEVEVRNWYLTMPKDQTEADERKFAELTKESTFEVCAWRGLAFLDGLASRHPKAVDYYFGGGRERLARQQEDLLRVLDARDAATSEFASPTVEAGMGSLYRLLNDTDPLFRYDFAVGAHDARDAQVPLDPPDDLVFVAQRSDGIICVTWSVYANCDESLHERPVPITLSLDADGDPELAHQFRLFADYGKPLTAPMGSSVLSMDLPGGLGGTFDNGTFTLGPTRQQQRQSHRLRLRATRADGTQRDCTLRMHAASVGGKGARMSGRHDGGAFEAEFLHDWATEAMPEKLGMSFTSRDITGLAATDALDGMLFLDSLPGSALAVAGEHGPYLPVGDVPDQNGAEESPDPMLEPLRLLVTIQNATPITVLVPDATTTTFGDVYEWRQLVGLLADGSVKDSRLGILTAVMTAPVPVENLGRFAFSCVRPLQLVTPLQTVPLGQERLYLSDGVVGVDSTDPCRVHVSPSPGVTWERTRLVDADSVEAATTTATA